MVKITPCQIPTTDFPFPSYPLTLFGNPCCKSTIHSRDWGLNFPPPTKLTNSPLFRSTLLLPKMSLFPSIYGLVVKVLDSQSRGPVFKTTWWLKVDSDVHLSEVDQMSTRNFWELGGKK